MIQRRAIDFPAHLRTALADTSRAERLLQATRPWPNWIFRFMVWLVGAPPLSFRHLWGCALVRIYTAKLSADVAIAERAALEAEVEAFLIESRRRGLS